jgi:predicted NAD/FAD-dependent oxidoreductase
VSETKIAIIGAGAAGIAAGLRFQQDGLAPVIFEKSRGFGGRCASRRWHDSILDHGAQYWTMRDPFFRKTVIASSGHQIRKIKASIVNEDGSSFPEQDRYYHTSGNNSLFREMAAPLDVRLESIVSSPVQEDADWIINGERFQIVVSTAPLPQTLALLGFPTPTTEYHPCLTGWFLFSGNPHGPSSEIYAQNLKNDPILSWTACENHKEGRVPSDQTLILGQTNSTFSQQHLEEPPATWLPLIKDSISKLWGLSAGSFLAMDGHRWRYARPVQKLVEPTWPSGFYYAGDAQADVSRVESAWCSGWNQAARILGLTA